MSRTARAIINDPSTITGLASDQVFIGGTACVSPWTGYEGKVITRFGSIWKPRDPIAGEIIILTDPDPMEEWQRVGSDWVLKRVVVEDSVDFGTIAAGDSSAQTVSVNGATSAHSIFVMTPNAVDDGLDFRARVTSADTVTVTAINRSSGSLAADDTVVRLLVTR